MRESVGSESESGQLASGSFSETRFHFMSYYVKKLAPNDAPN
jgi:hypothetical protein